MGNSLCKLLHIKYPVIQGGMVWCSGWRLASAVSNTGGLGLLGAGSMTPELLTEHIIKTREATKNPFGVNIPLMWKHTRELVKVVLDQEVPVVVTSAGNPALTTPLFKKENRTVLHVVANTKFARKSEDAGVDAVIAEGFEAGGHNGREETTTFTLLPLIRQAIQIPLIAAGGIFNARSVMAAMILGADGVQIGSRFAACIESSAHENYKKRVIDSVEGDTVLTLKKLAPVRFIKNKFYQQVQAAENSGAEVSELIELLGKGRARKAIFEGSLEDGEIETGQVSALINKHESVAEIMQEIITELETLKQQFMHSPKLNFV